MDELQAGHSLLDGVIGMPIVVKTTDVIEMVESIAQRIVLQIDEDDVETAALGILFAIGVLSFADAAPRGYSAHDYVEDDSFTLGDFVTHLAFPNGTLCLSTDYLRGRMMKTDVTIRANGTIELTTRNRGEAASRWVMRLQGKRVLRVLETPGDFGSSAVDD